jgi:transcriptional regulator GlxA family with amidase domain
MSEKSIHIVFPLFDGMAVLDFVAPHEAFSVVPGARITVASVGGRNIEASGLVLSGLADLSKVESCDVLCIPGGFGTAKAMIDEAFMRDIRRLASTAKYQTSVCTGALILGAAGLLRGKRAATYWASRDTLQLFGAIVEKSRVVRDGNIITGGGVTAGMDFALAVIAEIFGQAAAKDVQLLLEYTPAPPFEAIHPDDAPAETTLRLRKFLQAGLTNDRVAAEQAVARSQTS